MDTEGNRGVPTDPGHPRTKGDADEFAQTYACLRRLAKRELLRAPQQSINTTVLAHEAYLKLRGVFGGEVPRGRLLALAAKAMRHLLVDHVRAMTAVKRGGSLARITLHTGIPVQGEQSAPDLLVMDQALRALEARQPRLATLVECRFFGGMEFEEIAGHLGISQATVYRDWRAARAFLQSHLAEAHEA
ncbi:MAG: ECF-type sigma factor [Luteimonas sp.]|nr:ECF-type sigma factor [Luteimonas sp.]